MDLGSVAVVALIAGLAGGTVGAALVGAVEGMLRRATPDRAWRMSVSHSERARQDQPQPHTAISFAGLDPDSRKVIALARQEAIQNGHSYIGSENLVMALRLYSTAALDTIWKQLAIEADALRRRIEATVPPILGPMPPPVESNFTPRVSRIVAIAGTLAAERKRAEVPPELLLVALAGEGGGTGAHALASLGATAERIRTIVDAASS